MFQQRARSNRSTTGIEFPGWSRIEFHEQAAARHRIMFGIRLLGLQPRIDIARRESHRK